MWMNEWFHLGQQHQMAHPAEHCTEPGRALLGYFQGVLTGSLQIRGCMGACNSTRELQAGPGSA